VVLLGPERLPAQRLQRARHAQLHTRTTSSDLINLIIRISAISPTFFHCTLCAVVLA
jgi:hypothetical protein